MSALLLDDVADFLRRYVVLNGAQADTLALWAAHTHAAEAADTTPYVLFTSAEKRSGKTRLLEALELVVHEPLPTSNISDAALFRAVAELKPTLLLDEVDAIFGGKAREREDLRGLLNAGYRRGAVARRMGGPKMTTLEAFPVYCPKAFAAIGQVPDTIADRSIAIRLQRKTRDEHVDRFRRRLAQPGGESLRDRLADWLEPQLDYLHEARPELPDELDDRAQDCWEPLLAIADLAADDWPARARSAAIELSGKAQREDESLGVRLLADVRLVFDGQERMRSADLAKELAMLEEGPWGDLRGKPLDARGLAQRLRRFEIRPRSIRVEDGSTPKGYHVEQFADAFGRYLPLLAATSPRDAPLSEKDAIVIRHTTPSVAAPHEGANEHGQRRVAAVADGTPVLGDEMYPVLLAEAGNHGDVTEQEFSEVYGLHKLVERAREARAA